MSAMLTLWISCPDTSTHSERRFPPSLTVGELKNKVELITGVNALSQRLQLLATAGNADMFTASGSNKALSELANDAQSLEQCGVTDRMTIRVETTDPNLKAQAGMFSDLSKVEKFDISEAEYAQRSDSVLQYKQQHKVGRFAPPSANPNLPEHTVPPDWKTGDRCQVKISKELLRRGTIRFLGSTQFKKDDASPWVGVEWDEPVGKNDGSVDGVRYFQTMPLRASFVRPEKVEAGDFPEIDPFADDEEMEM